MGGILPTWKHQKSSKETLEILENEIQKLTQRRTKQQQCELTLVGSLFVAFLLVYPLLIGVGVILWVWFIHVFTPEVSVVYILLIALLPIMFYGLKKLLNMYFAHQKTRYDVAIQILQSDMNKVLDDVMEKEPYKMARELLQKYAPNHPSLLPPAPASPERSQKQETVRQRRAPNPPHPVLMQSHQHAPPYISQETSSPSPSNISITSSTSSPPQSLSTSTVSAVPRMSAPLQTNAFIPPGHCIGAAPGPPVPVPIMPRERSGFDKVVEYLVGDGPNNRYALICSECHSHNGMALKDDFEYLTFRCAYCYHVNPAHKTKPVLKYTTHLTNNVVRPQPSSPPTIPTTPLNVDDNQDKKNEIGDRQAETERPHID